jgi:predicted Zn-dependent protease
MTETRARAGLAAELVDSGEPQRAIDLLQPVIDAQPSEPYGVLARAWLVIGDAHAHIGARDRALEAYARVMERAPSDDPDAIVSRARRAAATVRSRR